MTNRVCVIPVGDPAVAHDVLTALCPDGTTIEIKNKYFQATLSLDFDSSGRPAAVLWICQSRFCDLMPPPAGQFQDAELRMLLRVVTDGSGSDLPDLLRDWEVESMAEIVNVNLATIDDEVRRFHEGSGRSSLLDEGLQPAGCRILEALEMVNWPIRASVGKSPMEQKVERLKAMLADKDPNSDGFEGALALVLELKNEIPNLPHDERHKYAAEVAMAFGAILMDGEDEDDEPEDEPTYQKFDDS
jgi:hypothetical protein